MSNGILCLSADPKFFLLFSWGGKRYADFDSVGFGARPLIQSNIGNFFVQSSLLKI
jgi:hypothetical protein